MSHIVHSLLRSSPRSPLLAMHKGDDIPAWSMRTANGGNGDGFPPHPHGRAPQAGRVARRCGV